MEVNVLSYDNVFLKKPMKICISIIKQNVIHAK